MKSTAIALTLSCAPVLAQEAGERAPDQPGLPRNLVPPEVSAMPLDTPDTATRAAAPPAMPMPAQSLRGRTVPSQVTVGDLGTVEGPVAGTLNDLNGGLGYDAWQGSDRATVIGMLQSAPASTPSNAARMLLRKVILTTAPPPPGRSDKSFNALRLSKLLEGGLVNEAADLALKIQAPMNSEILETQINALIYAGRVSDTCGDLSVKRLDSAERFWVELRAFCFAIDGQTAAVQLNKNVISEQGLSDPAFVTLLDGMVGGMPTAPESIALPDPLHVLMLSRLNLPMNAEISTRIGLPESLMAAAAANTPRALRVAAAEKALRAGVLPTALFGEILDLSSFTPQDLDGAVAIARGEPLMNALARLRAALKVSQRPEERAEMVHAAFEMADREGLLRQVAELFADDAAAIMPANDWGSWSDVMMRGLLLSGRAEAARRWLTILSVNDPGANDSAKQLELTLALAAPLQTDSLTTLAILRDLAVTAHPPPPAPPPPPAMMEPDPNAPADQPPPEPPPPPRPAPKPPQAVIARAALMLGLFEAISQPLPDEARQAVEPLVSEVSPGRRPPPALMQRIARTALAGSKGEVALSVMTALGPQGPRDLAPDVVVHLVRALQTAGIRDAAHELAYEAVLLRPAGELVAAASAGAPR